MNGSPVKLLAPSKIATTSVLTINHMRAECMMSLHELPSLTLTKVICVYSNAGPFGLSNGHFCLNPTIHVYNKHNRHKNVTLAHRKQLYSKPPGEPGGGGSCGGGSCGGGSCGGRLGMSLGF